MKKTKSIHTITALAAFMGMMMQNATGAEGDRDPRGRYPRRWDRPQNNPLRQIEILDMASASRGFLMGALAFKAPGDGSNAED